MQLGTSPLRLARNVVRCSCCGEALPGHAAGASVAAFYEGPHLVRVLVDSGAVHACPEAPWTPPTTEPDPGDF